jgi:hypothetical protein
VHLHGDFDDDGRFLHFQWDFQHFQRVDHVDGHFVDEGFQDHLDGHFHDFVGLELDGHFHEVGLVSFDDLHLLLQFYWHLDDLDHLHLHYLYDLDHSFDEDLYRNLHYLLHDLHHHAFLGTFLLVDELDVCDLDLAVGLFAVLRCCLEGDWFSFFEDGQRL